MATAKKRPLAPGMPQVISQSPQPTTSGGKLELPTLTARDVILYSEDPVIVCVGRLRGPATSPLPRPKVDTVDRPGNVGLTQWLGRDPFEMTVPVMFDRFAARGSVEGDIAALEALALRHQGQRDTPVVRVAGRVPRTGMRWRVADLEEIGERTEWAGDQRCRFAVDVHLVQWVDDTLLAEQVARGKGRGIANRKTTVRAGERTLYDVARRVYKDPSRASEIARANSIKGRPLSLAQKLPVGLGLRLP